MDVLSGPAIALAVFVSSLLWTALFGAICFFQPCRSYTWNGRSVACLHGVIISVLALVFGVWCNPSPFSDPGRESNFYEVFIQIVCLGFFLFDTVFCLIFNVYGVETGLMAVHHVISIAGMVTSLSMGVSGTEVNATIFLAECNNPMFQLRWFMREMGLKKYNKWYECNDFVFVVSFMLMRGVVSPYLGYCEMIHPRPTDTFKYFGMAFCTMNLILLVGITQFTCKKYFSMFQEWRVGDDAQKHGSGVKDKNNNRLRNGTVTFDEITAHKLFGWAANNIRRRYRLIGW